MSDQEKAWMAKQGASALRGKRLADSLDEIFEQYHWLFQRLAGNCHTNGCSCLECQAETFMRSVQATVRKSEGVPV